MWRHRIHHWSDPIAGTLVARQALPLFLRCVFPPGRHLREDGTRRETGHGRPETSPVLLRRLLLVGEQEDEAGQQPGQHDEGADGGTGRVPLPDGAEAAGAGVVRAGGVAPRVRVPRAGPAGAVGNRRLGFLDHVAEDDLHGAHLLADARGAVPGAAVVRPLEAAHAPVVAARALRDRGRGRVPQQRLDAVVRPRRPLGRRGHPPAQERLERELVRVAEVDRLACHLDHHLVRRAVPVEEYVLRGVEEPVDVPAPRRAVVARLVRRVVVLVHGRGAEEERADVVRELVFGDGLAAVVSVRAVVDPVRVGYEFHVHHPVPGLDGPVRVRGVTGVQRQARRDVEETGLRDGVLVVVAVVPGEDLPPQPAVAVRRVPPGRLRVEDGLGERQPPWFVFRGVREPDFSRRHNRHTPESLIIVPFCKRLVGRHVVVVRSDLKLEPFHREVIISRIPGVIPIINQCT